MKYNILVKDGYEPNNSIVIQLEFTNSNTAYHGITAAAKAACEEFLETSQGKESLEHNNGCFNWVDFANEVPTSICEKHGFSISNIVEIDDTVDAYEQLCNIIEVDDTVDTNE